MKTTVPWNEELYEMFCRKAMLTEFEKEVLRMRIMEYSIKQIMVALDCDKSKADRAVKSLREKYDKLQPSCDKLPVRKMSRKEIWMDAN